MFNKKWDVNGPKSAEAAIMLNMLEFLKESTSPYLEGELIVIIDNKLLHDVIHEKWEKAGHYVNDSGGMVTKIKELIRKVSFVPKFELITKYKNKDCEFNSDPGRYWMCWKINILSPVRLM